MANPACTSACSVRRVLLWRSARQSGRATALHVPPGWPRNVHTLTDGPQPRRSTGSCAGRIPLPGQLPHKMPARPKYQPVGWEHERQGIDKHPEGRLPPPGGWRDRSCQSGMRMEQAAVEKPWQASPPARGTVFRSLVPAGRAQRYAWMMSHIPGLAAGHSAPEAAWRTRLMIAVCRATKEYEENIPLGMTATYLGCPPGVDRRAHTFSYPSMKEWARETKAKPAFTQAPQTLVTDSREWQVRITSPPAQWWIKRAAGVTHSSPLTADTFNGRVTLKHIFFIAQAKIQDLDPPPRKPLGYPGQYDTLFSEEHDGKYLFDAPAIRSSLSPTMEVLEYDLLLQCMCRQLYQMADRMGIQVAP